MTNHIRGGQVVTRLQVGGKTIGRKFFEIYGDVAFFNRQTRVVLRHNGVVDPGSIAEYFHYRGFQALANVLEKGDPNWVIEQVRQSKLRGRGGGGYPTGEKWAMGARAAEKTRYIICNADEGDPGAFMDRSMLESDPFNVVEGMIIGGYAIGASRGFFYVRAEYPLAIERIQNAIGQCRAARDSGQGHSRLRVRLRPGDPAGRRSLRVRRGDGPDPFDRRRTRAASDSPPLSDRERPVGQADRHQQRRDLRQHHGHHQLRRRWFSQIGTQASGGTKVFALAGKIKHTGLVEVPMGTTLRELVEEIGGGVVGGKKLKAVQTGGPAGGCIPAHMLDLPIDFDSLTKVGSIMGSGGMIVLDEDDCMVDMAKFFMTFSQDESCGKCTPCREGTTRMLEILERITGGHGTVEDLDLLERLAKLVKKSSLCGLGRAAPNPVLSTLNHYRDEYLAHVQEKRCPAKKCVALVHYEIDEQKCVGCTVCARNCPVSCISGNRREVHVIDQERCIKCGRCVEVCRFDAVLRN